MRVGEKKLRRVIATALVVVMIMAVFSNNGIESIRAYADDSDELTYTVGGTTFWYRKMAGEDALEIYQCQSDEKEVTIPSEINGVKVKKIAQRDCGFYYLGIFTWSDEDVLEKVIVEDGIEIIDDYAFCGADMEKIELPNTIKTIGWNAFTESNLEEISIPESVTHIGAYAFWDCRKLKKVYISKGLEELGTMETYMSSEKKKLIGIFAGCYNFESLVVDEDNPYYMSYENSLYTADGKELIEYNPSMTELKLLPQTEIIGTEAFLRTMYGDSKIITLPDGITELGYRSFACCHNLTEFNMPDTVVSLKELAFESCESLKSLKISKNLEEIGQDSLYECNSLQRLEIPDKVNSLGYFKFGGCKYVYIGSGFCEEMDAGLWDWFTSDGRYVEISEHNPYYKSFKNSLYTADGKKLLGYGGTEEISQLLGSVEVIGDSAIYTKGGVILPDSVKEIENSGEYFSTISADWVFIPRTTTIINTLKVKTIYGYTGSEAETYAKNNGITFKNVECLESNGITAEIMGVEEKNTPKLFVRKITEEDDEYKNISFEGKTDDEVSSDNIEFECYYVGLTNESGEAVETEKDAIFKLTCPEKINAEKCYVYAVDDKGTFTDMNAIYDTGDNKISFVSNKGATYIVTDTKLKSKNETTLIGDVNDDGEIDSVDAVLLKKYLAGYEGLEINLEACDTNGDGEISSSDSVMLLKYLSNNSIQLG